MVDYQSIYMNRAADYERLIAREDYQGNILRALQAIRPFEGLDVVELGAGTGRLTCMLAPLVNSIRAYDIAQPMLAIAEQKLRAMKRDNWQLVVGDNLALPADDDSADVAVAGWSFGHSTAWNESGWRDDIRTAVGHIKRVLRSDGVAIILETMGTGTESPAPPSENLAAYYKLLEDELSFAYKWIRTDYQFESLREAEELTRFFFGDELADQVVANEWIILPECTGIWWFTSAS